MSIQRSVIYLWPVVFFVVISACVGANTVLANKSDENAQEWDMRWEPSPDASPRSLILETSTGALRIPEQYFRQGNSRSGFAELNVFWPGMTPLHSKSSNKYGPLDWIALLLNLDPHRKPPELYEVVERDIARNRIGEPVESEKYPGLTRRSSGPRAEFFLAKNGSVTTPKGNPLVIKCLDWPGAKNDEGWRCHSNILLPNGVALTYRFKKKHLTDWKAIHTEILELLDSFGRSE